MLRRDVILVRMPGGSCMDGFFLQAEDGIRAGHVTGVQTCALPICRGAVSGSTAGRSFFCRGLFTRRVICGLWVWGFGNRVPQNFVPVAAFGFGLFVGGHAVAGGDFGIQDAESDLAFLNNTEATPCLLFNVGIAFVLIDLGEQALFLVLLGHDRLIQADDLSSALVVVAQGHGDDSKNKQRDQNQDAEADQVEAVAGVSSPRRAGLGLGSSFAVSSTRSHRYGGPGFLGFLLFLASHRFLILAPRRRELTWHA